MAYLSLKYCGKNVKTYAGNIEHLTMSPLLFFFLKFVIDALKRFLVFAFFGMSIALRNHTLNPRDHYPPLTLRITPQP